jgi:hypothetical protein
MFRPNAPVRQPRVVQSLFGRGIPTANQAALAVLRINSMGLAQMAGGKGASVSSIRKSPVGES